MNREGGTETANRRWLQRLVRPLVSTEMLCVMAIIMAVASMVLNVLTWLRDADANNSNPTEQVTKTK